VLGDSFWQYVVLEGKVDVSPVAADPHDDTVEQLIALYRAGQGKEHPDWDEFRAAMVTDQRLILAFRPERAYGIGA
jgi:hypothetical protein